jgi:Na+-transporting methylmalonyl-CoA/oxaloacetate decarboxylase gamma subunit
MKSNIIIFFFAFLLAFVILGLSELVGNYKEKKKLIEVENSNSNYLDSTSNASY